MLKDMIIVVMGVSGSGKTTFGKALSSQLGLPFYDADDFHPRQNVNKMKKGQPLNDDDRQPWLEKLRDEMQVWSANGGAVLACSALKEKYRKTLKGKDNSGVPKNDIRWVYLDIDRTELLARLNQRKGHYFPPELLDSQLDALEKPADAIYLKNDQSQQIEIKKVIYQLTELDSKNQV